jgi:integrase/recombinase XerD
MDVQRAAEGFLLNLAVEAKSEDYIAWCRYLLQFFQRQVGSRQMDEIKPDDVRHYIRYLQTEHIPYGEGHPLHKADRHLSPNTIKNHWAALSAFFSWATREGVVEDNIMRSVPRPKTPNLLQVGFTVDEVKRLIKATESKGAVREARDKALLLFMLDTGCRISEVAGCRYPEVDLISGRVKVRGKGAKERLVYLGQVARKAVWRYVTVHRPEPMPGQDCLFLTEEGRKFTRFGLTSLLVRLGNKAGVEHVHAHRFRYTAAVEFLRNGGDVFTLQRMLGHTSLEMVKRYLALVDADVAAAHRRASPADNWGLR